MHRIHLAKDIKSRKFTLFEHISHIKGVIGNDAVVQKHRLAPSLFRAPLLHLPPTLSTSTSPVRTDCLTSNLPHSSIYQTFGPSKYVDSALKFVSFNQRALVHPMCFGNVIQHTEDYNDPQHQDTIIHVRSGGGL